MRVPATVLCLSAAALLLAACAKQEPPAPAPAAPPAAAPAAPAASAAPAGKAVFEAKCGACHGLDRVTGRKETKEGWADLVKKMRAKSPAITDGDAAAITEYLAATYGK
jgi:cytochrome c5